MYVSTPCTAHSILQHAHHTHGRTLISQLVVAIILGNSIAIAILSFTVMLILHVFCTAHISLLHAAILFFDMGNQLLLLYIDEPFFKALLFLGDGFQFVLFIYTRMHNT